MIGLKENIKLFLFYLDKNRGYSQNSILTYESALREMAECSHYYEDERELFLDITPFRLKIVKNQKRTISKKLSAVRSLLKFMNQQKELEVTLLGDSKIKVPQTLPKPIDEDIIKEVLEVADLKQRLIITMLYGLGLRISELADIRVDSLMEKWIKVIGKGGKERELPLHEQVSQQLNRYISLERPKEFLLEKNNRQMSTYQIRYLFEKLFKSRGIKATPHQLRHSFASHLLHNGARIADVSKLMGHDSMVSTQIYTKLKSSKKLNEYSQAHPLCDTKNL